MDLLKIFENNIIEKRHCILRSGKHSDIYVEKTKIIIFPYLYNEIIRSLANEITKKFNFDEYDIITGPAVAGICFASPVAIELGKPLIFPEKKENSMEFRDSFKKFILYKRIILIEDIVTTGNSIVKTAETIFSYGGNVIACFCIWNRNLNLNDSIILLTSI